MLRRILLVAAFGVVSNTALAQTPAPTYDVVIRNGRVLDGAGNPWILADVAIKDGRFVEDRPRRRARDARRSTPPASTSRPAGST